MTTKEFAAKLNADNLVIVDKLQACKTPEEVYAIAREEGVTDSFEVFVTEATKIYEATRDLSDEDLDNVSGGTTDVSQVITSIAGSLISGGFVAAAML